MAGATLLWRISRHTDKVDPDDMSGSGAEAFGGRWNAKGSAVVYSSTAISLAALETLAHLARAFVIRNSFLVGVSVPDDVWQKRKTVTADVLPPTWMAQPPGSASVRFGDAWLVAKTEALMLIPSVIIPEEYNALINPAHPEAARITATVVRQFIYDPRLK